MSDRESAISVDEGASNGGGGAEAQADSSGSAGRKKQKNQKKKFDISLPAQHLVSSCSNLDIAWFNFSLPPSISLSLSPPIVSW